MRLNFIFLNLIYLFIYLFIYFFLFFFFLFFFIFADNVTLLSRNIIKLIPLGASNSKYKKSAF